MCLIDLSCSPILVSRISCHNQQSCQSSILGVSKHLILKLAFRTNCNWMDNFSVAIRAEMTITFWWKQFVSCRVQLYHEWPTHTYSILYSGKFLVNEDLLYPATWPRISPPCCRNIKQTMEIYLETWSMPNSRQKGSGYARLWSTHLLLPPLRMDPRNHYAIFGMTVLPHNKWGPRFVGVVSLLPSLHKTLWSCHFE